MRISTRIEPLDQDVAVLIANDLSPEAASRMLADAAREVLDDAQARNRQALGVAPSYETFVDGRLGVPLDSVRPDGTIIFEFDILLDLFAWIGEQLVIHSPVRSGRYSESHAFYADGNLVDPGAEVPLAETYTYVNTQPYARKIERGLSPQAPDGVYQSVAILAQKRFGNVARVRFSYRRPLGGAINEWANRTSLTRKGRRMSEAARSEWLRAQPAIVITLGK